VNILAASVEADGRISEGGCGRIGARESGTGASEQDRSGDTRAGSGSGGGAVRGLQRLGPD
jgi:hypothetical protein